MPKKIIVDESFDNFEDAFEFVDSAIEDATAQNFSVCRVNIQPDYQKEGFYMASVIFMDSDPLARDADGVLE